MNLKQKKSEIANKALCMRNIVQYDDASIQEKTSYIHQFSLGYSNPFFNTTRIEKIHKYLSKKYVI